MTSLGLAGYVGVRGGHRAPINKVRRRQASETAQLSSRRARARGEPPTTTSLQDTCEALDHVPDSAIVLIIRAKSPWSAITMGHPHERGREPSFFEQCDHARKAVICQRMIHRSSALGRHGVTLAGGIVGDRRPPPRLRLHPGTEDVRDGTVVAPSLGAVGDNTPPPAKGSRVYAAC